MSYRNPIPSFALLCSITLALIGSLAWGDEPETAPAYARAEPSPHPPLNCNQLLGYADQPLLSPEGRAVLPHPPRFLPHPETYRPILNPSEPNTVRYPHGTVVHYESEIVPDFDGTTYEAGRVRVERPSFPPQTFARTNAILTSLQNLAGGPSRIDPEALKDEELVLDVGCSDGHSLVTLRNAGVRIYGLDILLKDWQRNLPNVFIEGDIANSGLAPDQFSLIYSHNAFGLKTMLEADGKSFLTEMKRILKVGGRIRLTRVVNIGILEKLIAEVGGLHLDVKETYSPSASSAIVKFVEIRKLP